MLWLMLGIIVCLFCVDGDVFHNSMEYMMGWVVSLCSPVQWDRDVGDMGGHSDYFKDYFKVRAFY